MRIWAAQHGELLQVDVPEPTAGPGQVVVEVRAAGLNAADLGMMRGTHVSGASTRPIERDLSVPTPMGSEAAGTVVAVGEGVVGLAPGDRVMSVCSGAFAPLVTMFEAMTARVPDHLSFVEAAAVPVTFTTAHDALTTAGKLTPGDNVLITAVSSGVGVAAAQLARLLGASLVAGTSRMKAKLDALAQHGIELDLPLVADLDDFVAVALEATGNHGFDVIIDSVGGGALANNIATAALQARLVSVGRSGGVKDEIDLDELARKRIALIGVTFRTRSPIEIFEAYQGATAAYLPALVEKRIHPIVDRVFPFDELPEAQAWMRDGRSVGKVVLARD
jgi:NADPH2:quinone reductase